MELTNKQKPESNPIVQSDQRRGMTSVQAQYVIAKKFPRDENESYIRIINACKRQSLAETSIYAYPRGGTMVTGPSIRLAEAIAQYWGNLDVGVVELSQESGVSVAEAYAVDLQTNTRVTKIFHVQHARDTKKGRITITDSREIYETVANSGARRLRACILAIIPGDIVEAAVEQCKRTLESSDVPISEQLRAMVKAFDELGVKVEHIERRLGHKLDATIPSEIVSLKGVYKSIKDGMASREQFFDIVKEDAREEVLKALGEDK